MNLSLLDFDQEAVCSVTLATGKNIYCCLECGRYFQGRQIGTPAYEHSISTFHSEFLNLSTGLAYSLPAGDELKKEKEDQNLLSVLRENLNPQRYEFDLAAMQDLQGRPYIRGLVPILSTNDAVAALVMLLARIQPVVEQLLMLKEGPKRLLVISRVMRKLWMRERMLKGRILLPPLNSTNNTNNNNNQQVAVERMLPMLLQGLDLQCLQGQLSLTTTKTTSKTSNDVVAESKINFTMLSVDLPPVPLFPDPNGKLPIPQVPLSELLSQKYNSGKVYYDSKGSPIAYDLLFLPEYLILTINGRCQKGSLNGTVLLFDPEVLQVPFTNGFGHIKSHSTYQLQAMVCLNSAGKYVCIVRRQQKEFYLYDSTSVKPIQTDSLLLFDSVIHLWTKVM